MCCWKELSTKMFGAMQVSTHRLFVWFSGAGLNPLWNFLRLPSASDFSPQPFNLLQERKIPSFHCLQAVTCLPGPNKV